MIYRMLAVAVLSVLSALVWADDDQHEHHHHEIEAAAPDDPPIRITINPEARVSVTVVGSLPPPAACGSAAELLVKVVNQGFVTAHLEANLVGKYPPGVTLDFNQEPLKGAPEELRTMRITLPKPGTLDLTVSFKLRNDIADLGGRDRVHFLISCSLDPRAN